MVRALFLATLVAAFACDAPPCKPGACSTANDEDGGTDGGTAGVADGGSSTLESYGTKPNGGHVSLDCTPNEIPAFAEHDCLYSHFQNPGFVKCTLKMADRLGVVIGVETSVSFMSEAGAVSPVATSPAFPGSPETLGHADGYLEVFASPLPGDVAPMPGERSASVDFGCGLRTANPRDGYVTVIAWVDGEEGFVDVNQNGKYDEGEPFVDEGEPFVDANDSGAWEPGEWFLDVNGDGKYSGPNGKWDADTVLWSQTRVVYTGLPAVAMDASHMDLLTRIYDSGTPPGPTPPPAEFVVQAGPPPTSEFYGVFFTDALLNPLDPAATYSAASAAENVTASLTLLGRPLRTPPERFRLLYCDKPRFPATCHDGPVESGCRSTPCYVVPEVGLCQTASCRGFEYGEYAILAIKGKTAGNDRVSVSAEVAGHTTTFSIFGRCDP